MMLGKTLQRVGTHYRNNSTEENRWQLVGWVIRHRHSLLWKADRDNVTLFYSSLHKNLIYILCSPCASLLIFIQACMFCCVVTDQHNYATERNGTVSPSQSPLSALCLSSFPFHWSSAHFNHQQCCPVLRQCPGEPEETGLKRIDSSYSKSFPAIFLLHWKYAYMFLWKPYFQ